MCGIQLAVREIVVRESSRSLKRVQRIFAFDSTIQGCVVVFVKVSKTAKCRRYDSSLLRTFTSQDLIKPTNALENAHVC